MFRKRDLFLIALIAAAFWILEHPSTYAQRASHLIKDVTSETKLLNEIKDLTRQIRKEEAELNKAIAVRESKKSHFFWWLNVDERTAVEEEQLKINDLERALHNTMDDVLHHWNKVKALEGVRSKMFATEIGVTMLHSFTWWIRLLLPFLSYSLLSLLMLGPIALLTFFATLSLSYHLFPILFLVHVTIFLFSIPSVIIQYAPSNVEFGLVYFILALVSAVLVKIIWPGAAVPYKSLKRD